MSDTSPGDRPSFQPGQEGDGKIAALVGWGLYLLSIPSANLLVIVGLVVAYASRASATGLARAHIEAQITLFWSVFLWSVGALIGIIISIPLMAVGVGFITIVLFALAWFVIHIWFTVKSIIGLLQLIGDRPPT